MIKRIFIFVLIITGIITFPLLIKYLINTQKSKLINNIYFNFPVIISKKKKCLNYDELLYKSLDKTFSASIINEYGEVISSYNEEKPRIPASNLKLLSTAYVLNKYKSSKNLKNSLYRKGFDKYYLVGNGDPDLNLSDLYKLISNINDTKIINLNILEIDTKYYWPNGWTKLDKQFDYGAPVTSLALNSNESKYKNIEFLKNSIQQYMLDNFPNSTINIKILDNSERFYMSSSTVLDTIESNPLLSLITLSNAESHNFTAESLFKNASNTWSNNNYFKLKVWLKNRGLKVDNLIISDASGLSRNNRVTTKLISRFLNKMKFI